MSAQRYAGPERREDGDAAILAAIEGIKNHFDERMTGLEAKVNPMYDYFVTARTGATIVKYVIGVVGSFAAGWVVLKGWLVSWIR